MARMLLQSPSKEGSNFHDKNKNKMKKDKEGTQSGFGLEATKTARYAQAVFQAAIGCEANEQKAPSANTSSVSELSQKFCWERSIDVERSAASMANRNQHLEHYGGSAPSRWSLPKLEIVGRPAATLALCEKRGHQLDQR